MDRALRSIVRLLAAWLGAACAAQAPAPAGDLPVDELAVELAAARHMRETYRSDTLTLDPSFARPVDAPGHPNAGRRDSVRTAALARALGARVASDRTRPGVYLLLSAPDVRADTAAVTVTAVWSELAGSPHGRSGYETRALVLARQNRAWRVIRERQLGIT